VSDGGAGSGMAGGGDVDPEIDAGEPIAELAAFEHDVSSAFLDRIRRAIHRRTAASQLTSFAYYLPLVLFKELWLMIIGQFETKRVGKDAENGAKGS
jgi:hypothetical protein